MEIPTTHAEILSIKNYHWPLGEESFELESWEQVIDRMLVHQSWLWKRALGRDLNVQENAELQELRELMINRRVLPESRTLWLGGTEHGKMRESSLFDCAFTHIETVYDLVDLFWLLLQGCGVGFRPITGTLNGFRRPLQTVEVIRSTRTDHLGCAHNLESYDPINETWTIQVGDSAEAWAKAVGKLVAGKFPAKKLILNFSEIRPAGSRLKSYGWLAAGDESLAHALQRIAQILSDRADQLLTRMDILDIVNHLGAVLASPKSKQMALFEYGQPEWEEFVGAKKDWWLKDHAHRQHSNNKLLFYSKPTREELEKLFHCMMDSGGTEPGFINAIEALRRAPWFKGCNPGEEALLGNKSFCNLTEVNLLAFRGDKVGLERALTLAARMNYRQTMVNLRDEILQEAWHLNNQFLHLCGVNLVGLRARRDLTAYDFKRMRNVTVSAAFSMAQELNAPLPKNITCIRPSETLSKVMGTKTWGEVPEGIHLPLGKYLLHSIPFSKQDPLLSRLKAAGYTVQEMPFDTHSMLVKFPLRYENMLFKRSLLTHKSGKVEELEINAESAVEQLNWYALLQTTWCEQNISATISYEPSEVPAIIDWLLHNWDSFVGVSFQFRHDLTESAENLGLAYLPQEVITEEAYEQYLSKLKTINFKTTKTSQQMTLEECLV